MTQALFLALAMTIPGYQAAEIESAHASNPVFSLLISDGFDCAGDNVPLPRPILQDSMTDQAQQKALEDALGTEIPLDEFLKDSPTAPVVVKIRNVPYKEGTARALDLLFTIHGKLSDFDLGKMQPGAGGTASGKGGSMSIETRPIDDAILESHGIKRIANHDLYSQLKFSVLEKIGLGLTCRSFTTVSEHSVVVAFRSVSDLDSDKNNANRWWPLVAKGEDLVAGEPSQNYPGMAGFAKLSQLGPHPEFVLVEAHLVFAEPEKWFNGAATLRSKLGLVAQFQVRALRKEIVSVR